ncbi:MAG TPA: putative dsRNA-binding protein [Solirubrobacterales bacterium]|nr:putative dsRNA-binding protein [Solirubrobacterales bacterium]
MAGGIRRLRRRRRGSGAEGPALLAELIDALPPDLRRKAVTHSSWVDHRADSYGRLAFLGDGVLGVAVAGYLFERFPRADIGRLTKVHGQAVSGRACVEVAEALGLPERVREAAPSPIERGIDPEELLASERALASVCEAAIGACYLHHGFQVAVEAVEAAFREQIELASETLLDFKSALQELLARDGSQVTYDVTREAGPPHDRRFEVAARVDAAVIGRGVGRSKKAAEQAAAAEALERIRG